MRVVLCLLEEFFVVFKRTLSVIFGADLIDQNVAFSRGDCGDLSYRHENLDEKRSELEGVPEFHLILCILLRFERHVH